MTAHDTTAPVFSLGKVNRKAPHLAKWDLLADVLDLITSVHLMAGLAGSAFFAVHMKEMHVGVAVPEPGQSGCEPVYGDIPVMTVKADGIILGSIGHVEFIRERFFQDLGVVRPVGVVACVTVVLFDWSVHIGGFLDLYPQLLVAGVTDILGRGLELPGVVRSVSGVAHSALFLVQSTMLDLGIGQAFPHLFVAIGTKFLTISQEHVDKIGGVGIVALVTPFFCWLVLVLELKLRLPVQVTEKTQIGPLQLHQSREIGGMGIVADVAVTGCHGPVNYLHGRLVVFMTGEAELAGGFLGELFLGVGLVRIVAGDTVPLGNRPVDHREIVLGFMAQVTEVLTNRLHFEIRFH